MVESCKSRFLHSLIGLLLVGCWSLFATAQTTALDPALAARAASGEASAQVQVGESYAAGKLGPADLKQAAEWYRKAADTGNLDGILHLAALYRDGGKNLPRDMTQAALWYQKAAELGDVGAQGFLGLLYSIGQGVPQSYTEAYYWLDLAAAMPGPKQAQYAQSRQSVGAHITVDELTEIEQRVAAWKVAHPRPVAAK